MTDISPHLVESVATIAALRDDRGQRLMTTVRQELIEAGLLRPASGPDGRPGRQIVAHEVIDRVCPACARVLRSRFERDMHMRDRHGGDR